ncbi:MAG: UDP-N-acetylmuramoyl-L-alanyl-D-glutamate--2,6-diaminopimelate ligase [Gammaproteobacteria bacterium]|nr:UDP-N-acetylmuramoyl-L-alanyl-D-glutamate--2,6-diaminopimelate ligase [Gammaproteobacteria bacterium]MXY56545.1 UDP-N-acetylmuramoyl-L-alanyl-D-glutamate--2,6-diaminopimelate ligase [Gammaproteobacteria bacterium]MYF27862.1 UDP-N-acetylmuramoyl-L-alanyl-D-glutamate--2,6-diaminopimelate ligase [Gammaproteobacteria bacterium]MYK48591.1 UDP-N-acetylmuramoyl-L-alanyl-D-glutamate--2,6-diaminopimelate ligase [Gammaproteobacteria bacterium]
MTRAMDLRCLLGDQRAPVLTVSGVASDSRRVQPGDVYVARRGNAFDGHDFVRDAVDAGAVAVVSQRAVDARVPNVVAPDVVGNLGALGARFYGSPSRAVDVVGITGTNGKTTVAYNIARLGGSGQAGYVGTLGWGTPPDLGTSALTTEDPLVLQARLRALVDRGVSRVALEASSHALDQGRLDAVEIDVGVFTNLSRDHLDYHRTMDRYAAAKRRLFERRLRVAVVNVDDPTGEAIAAAAAGRAEVVGIGRTGAVRWTDLGLHRGGIHGTWITPWGRRSFDLAGFFGEFSVYNAACVLTACCALGDRLSEVVDAMKELPGVPGRMQAVATRPMVFVDYAHTPEGLNAVLAAVRSHVGGGRLIVVFGCGGDRDQGKRALMARAAESGADLVVATTDNPRSESPESILDDVMDGFDDPQAVLRISDRREAIAVALDRAGAYDVVLVAGKGHEDYQEVDGRRLPWSDAGTVAELVHQRLAAPAVAGQCPRRHTSSTSLGSGDGQ